MPEWKYTNKTVTKEEAEKSLDAVKSACFKCETHELRSFGLTDSQIVEVLGVMELFTGYNKFLDSLAVPLTQIIN